MIGLLTQSDVDATRAAVLVRVCDGFLSYSEKVSAGTGSQATTIRFYVDLDRIYRSAGIDGELRQISDIRLWGLWLVVPKVAENVTEFG